MFKANVFRIMIGCPSDIRDEVVIAKKIILEWTGQHAESHNLVLLPLHWQENSYPDYGMHPQKMLDKQLVDKSDMLVCIFGSKLGTPTDTTESGSIEEIDEHIKAGKPVMIMFKTQIDITEVSPEQLQKLNDFKRRIGQKALYYEFSDAHDFGEKFKRALSLYINDNLTKIPVATEPASPEIDFSEEELSIFKKWSEDAYNTPYTHSTFMGGRTVIHLAYNFGITLFSNQEKAWWEDFMERLLKLGYIALKTRDKQGHPLYKITAKGYKFASSLPQ